MPITSLSVTLLVPGCFSDIQSDTAQEPAASEQHNATTHSGEPVELELNDSQVVKNTYKCYEQALLDALRLGLPAPGAIPAARLLVNSEQYPAVSNTLSKQEKLGSVVCADPAHLMAGTDNARLIPAQALDIQTHEADALIASLNELVGADGQQVLKLDNQRWIFKGIDASALDTWPSHAVANGKIASFLPRRSDASEWRRLFTEVQMLFHSHPVNMDRQSRGVPVVNALWFWGGAFLPDAHAVNTEFLHLYSDNALAKSLAQHNNIGVKAPDALLENVQSGECRTEQSVSLIYLNTRAYEAWLQGDVDALANAKHQFTETVLKPLQVAVANGQIDKLILDGCEGLAIEEKPKAVRGSFWKKWWPGSRSRG